MLLYLQLLEEDEDRLKFEQIYLAYRDLMYTTANHALHHPPYPQLMLKRSLYEYTDPGSRHL